MAIEHSKNAPSSFYKVKYWMGEKIVGMKEEEKPKSVSYLSQRMLYWVDMKKAIRGRLRGEYYIRGELREQFLRIATSLKAGKDIKEVSSEESAYLNKILTKQGNAILNAIPSEHAVEINNSSHITIPKGLHEKIAGINDAIQRIETQIQTGGLEKESAPEPAVNEQIQAHDANRGEWQEVLHGFQLYRDIFQTGMDNPKTQDGLYAALGEVAQRQGITEKEALKRMDDALVIAKKFAGVAV